MNNKKKIEGQMCGFCSNGNCARCPVTVRNAIPENYGVWTCGCALADPEVHTWRRP